MLLCCKSSAAVWTAEERGGEWEHRQEDARQTEILRKTPMNTQTMRDEDVKRCVWNGGIESAGSGSLCGLGGSSELVNLPINNKESSLCSFLLPSLDTLQGNHQNNSTGLKLTSNTTCSWKAFGLNGNRCLTSRGGAEEEGFYSSSNYLFFLLLCFTWREKPGTVIITV